jgi:light-regulated signal transduction histidine kinase (bacteriophytochrome)
VDVTPQRRAEETIAELNAGLERRVAQRTAELQRANEEMESFSYSVSHDLRAPVRALAGYARMLDEDHGGLLPAEGRRFLEVIQAEARRMGSLIDDLLILSRLGRRMMTRTRTDVGLLFERVVAEVRVHHPGRLFEIRSANVPEALADPSLLQQVLVNLVTNAVKYAKPGTPVSIELTGKTIGSENTYTIRDRGLGFDMRYADKLFGVFQRLHTDDDIEGTGIGLAIVERIISRHGGRVWAEGTPGQGASFHFTLPRAHAEDEEYRSERDRDSVS